MNIRVLKKLTHNGESLDPGTVVDGKGWRNLHTLLSSRYVEIVFEAEAPIVADVKAEKPKVKQDKGEKKPN